MRIHPSGQRLRSSADGGPIRLADTGFGRARPHQAHADVVDAIQRLLRTLQGTPQGARLDWQVIAPARAEAALLPDDLLELLGNLLENAAKWACTEVDVRVTAGDWIEILIQDDGPGVSVEQLPRLGERGLRLDERREGTGLGLAIARDVLDADGGRLRFDTAPKFVTYRSVVIPFRSLLRCRTGAVAHVDEMFGITDCVVCKRQVPASRPLQGGMPAPDPG